MTESGRASRAELEAILEGIDAQLRIVERDIEEERRPRWDQAGRDAEARVEARRRFARDVLVQLFGTLAAAAVVWLTSSLFTAHPSLRSGIYWATGVLLFMAVVALLVAKPWKVSVLAGVTRDDAVALDRRESLHKQRDHYRAALEQLGTEPEPTAAEDKHARS